MEMENDGEGVVYRRQIIIYKKIRQYENEREENIKPK